MTKKFTLTELVILIGILLLFAGVMPQLTAASRREGRAANCVNNLKACITAHLLYADDHKGFAVVLLNDPGYSRDVKFRHYWAAHYTGLGYFPQYSPQLSCPDFGKTGKISNYSGYLHTYGTVASNKSRNRLNTVLVNKQGTFIKTRLIESSDSFIIAGDSYKPEYKKEWTVIGGHPGSGNNGCFQLRHSGRANAGFADLHVAALTLDGITENLADSGQLPLAELPGICDGAGILISFTAH